MHSGKVKYFPDAYNVTSGRAQNYICDHTVEAYWFAIKLALSTDNVSVSLSYVSSLAC